MSASSLFSSERTGIRLSPVSPANGIEASDPQPLFEHKHDIGMVLFLMQRGGAV